MSDIATLASMSSGHDDCPPVQAATGSDLVEIDGFDVVRVGDTFEAHSGAEIASHSGVVVSGSDILEVDGSPAAFVGCEIGGDCTGHTIATGCDLVDLES